MSVVCLSACLSACLSDCLATPVVLYVSYTSDCNVFLCVIAAIIIVLVMMLFFVVSNFRFGIILQSYHRVAFACSLAGVSFLAAIRPSEQSGDGGARRVVPLLQR